MALFASMQLLYNVTYIIRPTMFILKTARIEFFLSFFKQAHFIFELYLNWAGDLSANTFLWQLMLMNHSSESAVSGKLLRHACFTLA